MMFIAGGNPHHSRPKGTPNSVSVERSAFKLEFVYLIRFVSFTVTIEENAVERTGNGGSAFQLGGLWCAWVLGPAVPGARQPRPPPHPHNGDTA